MIHLYNFLNVVRVAWKAASNLDRAGVLITLWLLGMTALSTMISTNLDALTKLCWLAGLLVVAWGQVRSLLDRAVQRALTDEFMTTLDGPPVLYDYAGMDHTYVFGVGWQKYGPTGSAAGHH